MPAPALILPVLCAFGAGAAAWVLARLGWRAAARGVVLAPVILLIWAIWGYAGADGMADLGYLVTILVMILPALAGAVIGLWLGQRARAARTRDLP